MKSENITKWIKSGNHIFYVIVISILVAILFTNPFLRYPYDIYHHLINIDRLDNAVSIPKGRLIWHFFWAKFFNLINIPVNEIFIRAKIIHIIQTFIAFFSIYYFSNVIIRNLFKNIGKLELKYLSLWSTIIWFIIFSTFSMHYHLIWNLWYSVNYQVTLPLFWYIIALTLVLVLEETSSLKKIFFILQILLISRFILQAHSMEYLYYLMYLVILSLIFIDRVFFNIKKYFYIIFPLILTIVYFSKNYQPEHSRILSYLDFNKLPKLYNIILKNGEILINGFNRSFAVINELMYFIFFITIMVIFHIIYSYVKNKKSNIDLRLFIFILITSSFVFIPLNQFSAGLFSVITKMPVVHRMYYSSSLFILLPIGIYYFDISLDEIKNKLAKVNITILVVLLFIFFYSKFYSISHNFYKNISSIKESFINKKFRFHLSNKQIKQIGIELEKYNKLNKSNKPIYYYARADISFVIKYIYRKQVYWRGRRVNPNYKKLYKKVLKKQNRKYHYILFDIPKGFPDYEPYR